MNEAPRLFPFLNHCNCFGCNPTNPKGLRLAFEASGPDRVRSTFTLSHDYVGLGSLVHGGIIATVFDDVMMWCLLRFRRKFYFTQTMEQSFRRPTLAGTLLTAESRIDEDLGEGRVRLKSRLFAAGKPEVELATGTGLFVEVPPAMLSLVPDQQRAELEGVLRGFAELPDD